jgi:hypothetical protein
MHYIRRALHRFKAPFIGALLLVCLFGFAVYANYLDTITVDETIHILPLSITESGWSNIETLYIQDLDETALYEDFTQQNSAHLRAQDQVNVDDFEGEPLPNTADAEDAPPRDTESPTLDPDTLPTPGTSGDGESEDAPSYDQATPPEPVGGDEVVPEAQSEPEGEVAPTEESAAAPSFISRVRERFALAFVSESAAEVDQTTDTSTPQAPPPTPEPQPEDDTEPTPVENVLATTSDAESGEDDASAPVYALGTNTPPLLGEGLDATTTDPASLQGTAGPSIVWNGFSLPALTDSETIENAQIRVSLGAQVAAQAKGRDITPAILMQYSFAEGLWVDAGVVNIEDEASNALNGGFYLFALPPIIDPVMLRSLKVRALYTGARADVEEVFIDSLWIELSARTLNREALEARVSPEALTDLEKPKFHELLSADIDFTDEELPRFELKYNQQRNIAVRAVRNIFSRRIADVTEVAVVHRDVGELPIEVELNETNDGLWTISIPEEARDDMRPGEYSLEVTVSEGGTVFTDTFDFQWGLLAINTDKNHYSLGEEVSISLGALSQNGNTLCEANLELYAIDTQNFIRRLPVLRSGVCSGNNVVDVPDYSATVMPMATGTYELYLEHVDATDFRALAHTGTTFTVLEAQSISLSRTGPTRIYPVEPYTMRFTLTATTSFEGVLTERLPLDYTVLETEGTVTATEDAQTITFPVTLLAGESTTLSYRFDSPDISPHLYELGPASLTYTASGGGASEELPQIEVSTTTDASSTPLASSNSPVESMQTNGVAAYSENKRWQIASDATGSMIVFWPSGTTTPAGWTCISCSAGGTFNQKLVRGGPAYNTTGGASTTVHSASGTVSATAAVGNTNTPAGSELALNSHGHTYTPIISNAWTIPSHRTLRVIQNNSAGEPATVPAGAILMFDSTLPSGWVNLAAQNGYYIMGSNTPNTASSSNTHTHTITGSTLGADSALLNSQTGGTQVTTSAAGHTHSVSSSTPSVNHEPPYIEVILATTTVATATPTGALTLWTDTPPAGWLNISNESDEPFYNRFIKAAATYGATGGSETHTHAGVNGITTSGPSTTDNDRTGTTGASDAHTHQIDVANFTTASHTPPYTTAIVARRYGAVSLFSQSAFWWYANTNAITPTDRWPVGLDDLLESEPISATSTTLRYQDQIRLRLGLFVENSTSTSDTFKLQFASTTELGTCASLSNWFDVGNTSSSTAWRAYDNSGVADGATLPSILLSATDYLETYEESNPTASIPNQIGIDEYGEWDFALEQNGAEGGADYCFRMVKQDGSTLYSYDTYPRLTINNDANEFALSKPFDNEKIATTTPTYEFFGVDSEFDSLTYQVQVDDDYGFGSVLIDNNSETNSTLFTNVTTPADKDPFNNGETIRFRPLTTVTNGTTYYWKVRGRDTGSNTYGDWSNIYSFTVDTTATTSMWFQTMQDQFRSDSLLGVVATSTGQLQLISGSTTGTTTTGEIQFDGGTLGNAWGLLSWNDNETVGDIKYRIQYEVTDDEWTYIPDSDLPGNAAGYDTSPQSLLTLDPDEYPVIRIEAVLTNSGGTSILNDWTLAWGYKINTPTITKLFSSEKTATTTPTFEFTTTDPQSDDLTYEVQWSTSNVFTSPTTRASDINLGFSNITNPVDPQPFTSGHTIQYKVQTPDTLTNGTTYWWRVRAKDPTGSNTYSNYSDPQSFTVDTGVTVSTWFQTTKEQFDSDILSGATTSSISNNITVATSADEALVVYAEGNIQTPRYRTWDGTAWTTEASAPSVGAAINWIVTRESPTREEYITQTIGTDQDVNVMVFTDGAWSTTTELTALLSDAAMRGADVVYETLSGDALAVSCDGDADPVYFIWNGTTWTNSGTVNLATANNCGFVRLFADPTSDEIVLVSRDVSGTIYEAQVWNGSSWGNSTRAGSMQAAQTQHEGIAGSYEESGGQAVFAVSNGGAANFISLVWTGAAWSSSTQAIGNDFEFGSIVRDVGTDNMAICYMDADTDIGYVRWNGANWLGQAELDTAGNSVDGRAVDCAFRTNDATFDGDIMFVYSDTANVRYRYWDTSAGSLQPALEGSVSTIQDAFTVQLRRASDGTLLALAYDDVNDRYDFSRLTTATTTWSVFQTLETDGSVGASPFKEPFMLAERGPGSSASVVVTPEIDWNEGSGPYWQSLSWNDSEPGVSTLLYQVEYYDGDSWELVSNSLIPGNSTGTTTSPISLINVLPVGTTYNMLRPVANLTCSGGSCPTLNDWTLTWAAGINISGTAQQYNQSTNLTSGTVAVALNGVLQVGKTATISAGTWSISNVNAAPGDVIAVFIDGVADTGEAVAVTVYDGVGDVSGMNLYERHLSVGSLDNATTTNANIGLYDNTNDEDLFFDVSGSALTVCAAGESACQDAEIIIKAQNVYQPGSSANVVTHDFENNGTFVPNGNTIRVSGSWDNNATGTMATSTVIFTATSTAETIDSTGASQGGFNNFTFGETSGTATWTLVNSLDVDGNLTVDRGTLARGTQTITVGGTLQNNANGFWTGIASTTFDGATAANWSDANAVKQNIGFAVVDGSPKSVVLTGNVAAQTVTIGQNDTLDANTPTSYDITVYGNFTNNNIWTARSGEVIFAATTTGRNIITNGSSFYDLTFNGVGGAWSFASSTLSIVNDVSIATGTVTFPTGTTTIAGSFINTGGVFAHNNGEIRFTSSGAETITLGATAFTNGFYDVTWSGSGGTWNITDASATTTNNVRILSGTPTFPSTRLSVGGSLISSGAFAHNNGEVRFFGSGVKVVTVNGSSFNNVRFDGTSTSTLTDTNVTVLGTLSINAGTTTLPSGTLTLGGSLSNSAVFMHSSGTVLFNSTDTGETISLGSSSLFNATFNSASGGWTINSNATTTNNFILTAANSFTLQSGRTLRVGGTFTNSVNGTATTWSGSTLALVSGTLYEVNAKVTTGDRYDTLVIGSSTRVSLWNSSATTTSMNAGAYLYSQDHAGVDGDLYIYGAYTRSSGIEQWSATTDFDGAVLGTPRQVDVRLDSGASVSLASSTLSVVGTSTATTTIAAISGNYTVSVSGGTTTMQYYDFTNLGANGITLGTSTKVTSFADGRIVPGVASGTGLRVSSSTIDANPALQIYRVEFSTTTPISATNVTQFGGTPASYWWFRNSTGNIDGEAFDADSGDPGSIRWDDSSYVITVSGNVYSDGGVTPMGAPTCDGVTTNIRIVVNSGSSTHNGTCTAGTGAFSIPGVTFIGDPVLTIFLNTNGAARGAVITKTPTNDITGLKIYQNRVITRHENAVALSIADMALYDEDNDTDLRFNATTTASTSLVVRGETELLVYASTTFTPGGAVTLQPGGSGQSYDATFHIDNNATATAQGTEAWQVGGRFQVDANAAFIPASSTVTMTATSTGKTISSPGTISFNNLTFSGTGAWDIVANLSVAGNMNVNAGTVTGAGNIGLTSGSLLGAGTLSLTGGTATIERTNTLGSTTPWQFFNLVLGNGSVVGTTTRGDVATTTILNRLTVASAHTLNAQASRFDLRGSSTPFVVSGNFNEGTSRVRYAGSGATTLLSDTYFDLDLNAASGSPTYTATAVGINVLGSLTVGGQSTTSVNLDTNDPALSVSGNVFVRPNGVLIGSGSGLFSVLGNFDNDGTFTSSGGTVSFLGAVSSTIAAGNSNFANVVINGDGTHTILESATATAAFTLTKTGGFTLGSGLRLSVGGEFSNDINGALTTWTGSVLNLFSQTNYEVNPKSTADSYATLTIASSTDIRLWNSNAATTTVDTTGSLYSQDHANNNGWLYIFGEYDHTSGNDYWSYGIDFDGTELLGASRKVDVSFASGTLAYYTGGGLWVFGTTSASTTVTNQGSGTYSLMVGGTASTTMRYYEMRNMAASGVVFTGTPNVVSISNGDYRVTTAGGSAITVGGSAITQNPAKTFTTNRFATTTAISATNVTATGTTVSSWRFTNEVGNISGEAYDNDPGGDPGYVVWTNSASNITVSGRVYSDEGSTVSAVCDGSTNVIRLVVAGVTTYDTFCNAGTGVYTIPGVTFSANDTLTVFINGAAPKAATVSADPVSTISDMDLYENRVIVRHENTTPLSIADMAIYDSTDDVDIPYTAVDAGSDTLSLPANRKLIVWSGKEFAPAGNVTVAGGGGGAAYDGTLELFTNALFTAQGTEAHSIGGSFILGSGATFTSAQSTVTMTTSGASRTIDVNQNSFYNLTLNGSGSWTVTDATMTASNNLTVTAGALTLPTGSTTVAGSFANNGGSFAHASGTLALTSTSGGKTLRLGGSSLNRLVVNGAGGGWTMTDTNATTSLSVAILAGSVTFPTGTFAIGSDLTASGTIVHNSGTVRLTGTSSSAVLRTGGSDLGSVVFAGSGSYSMQDSSLALLGSLTISSGAVTFATNTLSIAGSLTATGGTFAHASGTVLMNSTDAGETLNPGNSRFYNLTFANATGGWTVAANATTTNNFTLSTAASFRQASSTTLQVSGVFTNSVGGGATNWDGSTLLLSTTSTYAINTKSTTGDRYNILSLGSSTQLSIWNSNATTTTTAVGAGLYSQDHGAVDGELNIFGEYSRASGADYWNYAIDFDGTVLVGGARRAVTVRMAANATTTFSGNATLNMVGDGTASTTVTNQGSGTYSVRMLAGALNAQHYRFRNLGAFGLELLGTTTVTSLSSGDFELVTSSGSLITVASSAVNANASAVHTNVRFATTTAITGTNVVLVGTTSASWTFTTHTGNLSGEAYDSDGLDNCGSIRWQDSACLLLQQSHYRWRNDDGGEGVPTSEWYNASWTKRQRVAITNSNASPYTNIAVKVSVPHDGDMQTTFGDLRFTAADGVTPVNFWRETYTASTQAVVWVEVPTLAASADTSVFMYYGNALATDASNGTTTFNYFDDFEDDDIDEYTGDTSMFNVGTSFAYERTYGLDAGASANLETVTGMYKTSAVTAPGETVRYLQYVDTTVTGNTDETCTQFGVQGAGSNYAVCFNLVGTDRVLLVEDVTSDADSGTILSSSTITFATGWHEVEVDWLTSNLMFVSVYRNGALVATTSATDSTHGAGGMGFSYWFQHGGWDAFTTRPYTAIEPTTRFGVEQVSNGASWMAPLNTFASSFVASSSARLRFVIENTGLAVTGKQFRLEYAEKGVAPSCESVSGGSYVSVPVAASCGSSPICMVNSSQVSNLASTTDQLGGAGQYTFGQIVENTSNKTDALNLGAAAFTEVEYAIVPTVNATAGSYCLRTTNDGTALDSYSRVAEMRLRYNPIVTNVVLNNGNDITLSPGATTTVSATATITDLNGYADMTQATATLYRSGVASGSACAQNDNSCYQVASTSCTRFNCSGYSCALSCSADIYYFADPTDIGTYNTEDWRAYISVKDTADGYGTSTSAIGKELLTLRALEVTQTINYGAVESESNTGAYNASTTVDNVGNDAIDVSIAGTNLTSGSSTIPVVNQKFSTTTFSYSGCTQCSLLATSTTNLEVDLAKPTSPTPVADDVFWGIAIPFGVAATPHQGQNTFYAIGD